MPNWLAGSPIAFLLAAALLLLLIPSRHRVRWIIASAAVLFSGSALYFNFLQATDEPSPLLSAPAPAPDLLLALHYQGGAVLFGLIVLFGFFALLLFDFVHPTVRITSGELIALAGALFFLAADNWLTVAAAWLLVDIGIVLIPVPDENRARALSAFTLSQVGVLSFLGAGLLLASFGTSVRLEEAVLDGVAATLVWVGAWIRSAMWPFSTQRYSAVPVVDRTMLTRLGVPALLGFFLFSRALVNLQGDFEQVSLINLIALFGLAASGLQLVNAQSPEHNLPRIALALGAPIFIVPLVEIGGAGPSIIIWLGFGMYAFLLTGLSASLFAVQTPRQPWVHVLWSSALLIAAGFPITPAFLGRVGLYAGALQSGNYSIVAALTAIMTLALVPLWRAFFHPTIREARPPGRIEYAVLAFLLIPLFAAGIQPFRLLAFFGRSIQDAGAFAYDALFNAPNGSQPAVLMTAMLLPLPLSFIIARRWELIDARVHKLEHYTRWLNLIWLERLLEQMGDDVGVALRQVLTLLEQHPVGWLIFVAIWLALWILNFNRGS